VWTRRYTACALVLMVVLATAGVSYGTEPVTLRFWTNWGEPSFSAIRAALDEFEAENPGIRVELEQGVATDKVISAIAAGVAPNAFVTSGGYFTLIGRGYLQPLDSFIEQSEIANSSKYPPDIWESLKVDGKVYGLPALEAASVYGLRWNERHLQEAGLVPFTEERAPTYDEVIEYHHKLTRVSGTGVIENLGYLPWSGVQSGLNWWSLGFGAQDGFTYPREDGQVRLNLPELAGGLELIAENIFQMLGPANVFAYMSESAQPYSNGLFRGAVSIAGDGYWSAGRAVVESPDETYGTTWMPSVDGGRYQLVGGFRVVVPVGVDNLAESWKLAEFVAGPRMTHAVFDATGFATPHVDFITTADMDKYPGLALYMRDLGRADYIATPPNFPYSSDIERLFREAAEKVFRGEESSVSALSEAERLIAAIAQEAAQQ